MFTMIFIKWAQSKLCFDDENGYFLKFPSVSNPPGYSLDPALW